MNYIVNEKLKKEISKWLEIPAYYQNFEELKKNWRRSQVKKS